MFTVHVPLLPVLHAVACHCRATYLSTVHEILEDNAHLYGIELELPRLFDGDTGRTFYFWAHNSSSSSVAYEEAAEQALRMLQDLYGFVVHDYNSRALLSYTQLARNLFRLANRGAHLARLIVTASEHDSVPSTEIIASAEDLLYDMQSMSSTTLL